MIVSLRDMVSLATLGVFFSSLGLWVDILRVGI